MPRVNIREIDNTGSDTRSYIENIALLPALKLEGYDEDDNLITVDGTYTTLASFEAQVKKVLKTREIEWIDPEMEPDKYKAERAAVKNLDDIKDVFIQDKGYAMAHMLLSYGLPIDYKGVYNLEHPIVGYWGNNVITFSGFFNYLFNFRMILIFI